MPVKKGWGAVEVPSNVPKQTLEFVLIGVQAACELGGEGTPEQCPAELMVGCAAEAVFTGGGVVEGQQEGRPNVKGGECHLLGLKPKGGG